MFLLSPEEFPTCPTIAFASTRVNRSPPRPGDSPDTATIPPGQHQREYPTCRPPLDAQMYCRNASSPSIWRVATPKNARAHLRIVLADDQPTILRMVRLILDEHPHLEIVGEAPNGLEAVSMVARLKPDVVVLNVVMPKMSGFEAARRIHAQSPSVAIVILSSHKDEQFLAIARESGATGYVEKLTAGTELVNAIDATASGKEFFLH